MNQSGLLSREEPYTSIVAATTSATPVYGILANNRIPDGILVLTTGNLIFADQNNGPLITLTGVAANTIFPIGPCRIDTTATGTYAVMYK